MPKQSFNKLLWLIGIVMLCGVGIIWFTMAQRPPLPFNLAAVTPQPNSTNTPFPTLAMLSPIPLPTSTPTLLPDLGNYDQEIVFAQAPITTEAFTDPYHNSGCCYGCCPAPTSGWPGKTQIYRASLKGLAQHVLETPFSRILFNHSMKLSPNGETLGILALNVDERSERDLYQLSLPTGNLTRLMLPRGPIASYWSYFDWAPDSSRFVFGAYDSWVEMGFRDSTKWLRVANRIPLEGPFLEAALPAVWSPDSSQFASTNFKDAHNLWLVDRDGKQITQLFSKDLDISIEAPYVWSPDSKYLAFSRSENQPYQNVYLIDVANKQVRQVTDFAKSFPQSTSAIARSLIWLPDSETILFTLALDQKSYRVMLLNIITRRLSALSDFPPLGFFSSDPKEFYFSAPALVLSPNGKTLLIESGGSELEKDLPLTPQIREYVGIDTLTGKITWRFPNNRYVRNPRWSPDNYFIAAESGSDVYAWNVVTGKEIQLTDSKGSSINYLLGWIPKTGSSSSTPPPSKTP